MINSRTKRKRIAKALPLKTRQPILEQRQQDLKVLIAHYDSMIGKVYQALGHIPLQTATLSLSFSFSTPNDPQPMDLDIYWPCMDRAGLQELLQKYANSLIEKKNGHWTELQNITRQLESLGIPDDPIK